MDEAAEYVVAASAIDFLLNFCLFNFKFIFFSLNKKIIIAHAIIIFRFSVEIWLSIIERIIVHLILFVMKNKCKKKNIRIKLIYPSLWKMKMISFVPGVFLVMGLGSLFGFCPWAIDVEWVKSFQHNWYTPNFPTKQASSNIFFWFVA